MTLGAAGRLAVAASPTASQVLHLWAKGRFLRELESRLEPLSMGESMPEAVCYGVGCVTSRGASLGVPLETVGTHLLAIDAAVTLGITKAKCLVGKHMSFGALPAAERAEARRRANEHFNLVDRIQQWSGFDLEALFDSTLKRTDQFRAQEESFIRHCGVPRPELWYFAYQFLHFETIAQMYGAWLKVGWSMMGNREASKIVEQFRAGQLPHGRCEAAHDSFTLAQECARSREERISFVYFPAALSLTRRTQPDGRVSISVAPYSTSFPEDRILLRRGEQPARKFPDPRTVACPHLQRQIVDAGERFRGLVELVHDHIPNLLDRTEPGGLRLLDREIEEQQEELGKFRVQVGLKYQQGLRNLRALRLERAVLLREMLLPQLARLIETFAVS
ncbi:MAG: hypothetical protein K1X83_00175 [Oligoflexia bacterium]|nr:hypothetical protein [Oligoflexia bacterium]